MGSQRFCAALLLICLCVAVAADESEPESAKTNETEPTSLVATTNPADAISDPKKELDAEEPKNDRRGNRHRRWYGYGDYGYYGYSYSPYYYNNYYSPYYYNNYGYGGGYGYGGYGGYGYGYGYRPSLLGGLLGGIGYLFG